MNTNTYDASSSQLPKAQEEEASLAEPALTGVAGPHSLYSLGGNENEPVGGSGSYSRSIDINYPSRPLAILNPNLDPRLVHDDDVQGFQWSTPHPRLSRSALPLAQHSAYSTVGNANGNAGASMAPFSLPHASFAVPRLGSLGGYRETEGNWDTVGPQDNASYRTTEPSSPTISQLLDRMRPGFGAAGDANRHAGGATRSNLLSQPASLEGARQGRVIGYGTTHPSLLPPPQPALNTSSQPQHDAGPTQLSTPDASQDYRQNYFVGFSGNGIPNNLPTLPYRNGGSQRGIYSPLPLDYAPTSQSGGDLSTSQNLGSANQQGGGSTTSPLSIGNSNWQGSQQQPLAPYGASRPPAIQNPSTQLPPISYSPPQSLGPQDIHATQDGRASADGVDLSGVAWEDWNWSIKHTDSLLASGQALSISAPPLTPNNIGHTNPGFVFPPLGMGNVTTGTQTDQGPPSQYSPTNNNLPLQIPYPQPDPLYSGQLPLDDFNPPVASGSSSSRGGPVRNRRNAPRTVSPYVRAQARIVKTPYNDHPDDSSWICRWEGCNAVFATFKALESHVVRPSRDDTANGIVSAHNLPRGNSVGVRCRWDGDGCSVTKEAVWRHIYSEAHLNVKFLCTVCGISRTRPHPLSKCSSL
ncbi:hypothetical protein M413DRAFT_11304 [Hebeloma cylindrosporum]|uniref:Uncharacterized protein n=1 Tax=Hebeloma cylindrosporum TaxID=76867 RepID=A0A0C3CA89_HEBCY|nr:hypothetical protein M413DRAFT_11304 [Hebeloma cylindrosporum h7]